MRAVRASLYAGPIPPPEALAHYEDVLPGLADRIMAEAERQQAHRQALETSVVQHEARRSMAGLFVGGFVALAAIVVAGVLAAQGQQWFGIATALATIVSLAGVFVHGTQNRSRERAARLRDTLRPTIDVAAEPAEPEDPPAAPELPRE